MIYNLVDHRINKYRWKCINAVVEPIWQDDNIENGDDSGIRNPNPAISAYEELGMVSLHHAVCWAEAKTHPVTLFLYDEEDGFVGEIEISLAAETLASPAEAPPVPSKASAASAG